MPHTYITAEPLLIRPPCARDPHQGRDTEAAAGFLDEITLLNKLRGRSNIIQLIDSEVRCAARAGLGWALLRAPACCRVYMVPNIGRRPVRLRRRVAVLRFWQCSVESWALSA